MKRLFFILLIVSVPLMAAETGSITGRITDGTTGKALSGVKLVIKGISYKAITNSKGMFQILKVPEGVYAVKAALKGYETQTIPKVKVRKGKTTRLNLKLKSIKRIDKTQKAKTQAGKIEKKNRPDSGTNAVVAGKNNSGEPGSSKSLSKSAPKKPRHAPKSPQKESKYKPSIWSLFNPPPPMDPAEEKVEYELSSGGSIDDSRPQPKPQFSGGLKAGFADDNQQFNYFLNFLQKYDLGDDALSYDVSERIHFQLQDIDGKSLPNVKIEVFAQKADRLLDQGKTYSDGSFYIFPAEIAEQDQTFRLTYTVDGIYEIIDIQRNGPRTIRVNTSRPRPDLTHVPVDIVFILDTTGSMAEEIRRLLETIDIIHMNLTNLPNQPLIRFGMVLYRDKEDEYCTKVVPLTADIDEFRRALEQVEAAGGGDTPEDLQAALESSLHEIEWNEKGLRLGFVVTDAPPHLDYEQNYTYILAALEAKRQGIKLFTVGTGGLDIQGEYILRQIAQLTYAKYLFLTYGNETGENIGGRQGSVSHHTGSNYQTDKLEAIIIRIAKEEVSNFTDEPLTLDEDYYEAQPVDHETREETLAQLFKQAVSRLVDYSTIKIANAPRLGVLPILAKTDGAALNAEYFSEQLLLSVAQNDQFTLIARKDLQQVLEEQKLQLSGLLTEDQTIRIGELLGAELLLSAELYEKDTGYDLFIKLLRVESAEILAVTKIIMDKDLGL